MFRAIRRILQQEIAVHSIPDPMDDYAGYSPPPDYRGSRRRLLTAIQNCGLTIDEFKTFMADAVSKEGARFPQFVQTAHNELAMFEMITD